jgi:hypothetical protein
MFELSEIVERKFVDSILLDDEWEIESDEGWVPITHIHKTVEYDEWVIEADNEELICADTHILFDENLNQIFAKDLIPGQSYVMLKSGPALVSKVVKTEAKSNMFDVTVDSENHRFYSGNFLSHNTTTTVGYMLWCVLFQDEYSIAILANKGGLAQEILSRLQKAYEYLPLWLQQGIIVWNKRNIELENGSKIFAYATSASGVRGGSYNCISGNSKITLKINGKIFTEEIKNLSKIIANSSKKENISGIDWFEKIFGTCKQDKQKSREDKKDSGKTSWYEKVFRESFEDEFSKNWKNTLEQRNENENDSLKIEVLTNQGFKRFNGVKRTKNQKTIKLYFANNQNLVCTEEHKIYTKKGWKNAKECLNESVLTKNNTYENIYKIEDGEVQDVFDLLEVEDTHSFFANNILVHNCIFLDEFAFVQHNMAVDFFQSTYPVISSGQTSKVIIVSTPNGLNLFYKMWTDAIEKRSTYKPIEIHWSMVPGRDENWKKETIRNTSEEQFRVEFECVDGDTIVEIFDKKTKEEYRVRIKDLYEIMNLNS